MTVRRVGGALAVGIVAGVFARPAANTAQGPGRGGFGGAEQALVAKFDRDGNKRLDPAERTAAREYLASEGGARGGFGRGQAPVNPPPGPKVDRNTVRPVPASVPLYDLDTVRTYFFDFETADWEKELMSFKETDIEVPATLTVDGQVYPNVGTQFRGASSFMMVPEGLKHSFNVSVDAWSDQHLLGFRSLNLLNNNGDPSHLRAVLYLLIAREYGPAARANFAKVVLNGESWGIYGNVEQVNKDFIDAWFKTEDGDRWKVPGNPGGRGGLEYFGANPAAYRPLFEIKSKDNPRAWEALIELTRVLNETPAARLETALKPILNVDGALRFLAVDNTLVNADGYWTRASDYNLYRDPKGVFHVIPHDANETLGPGGGRRGGRGGMMGGDATLDLLVGLTDVTKPLRSKLLAVPALRARYLDYCRDIAMKWLDWNRLGPIATQAHALIAADVRSDTRKLSSNEAFDSSLQQLKAFVDARRAYVLNYSEATR